MPNLPDHFFVSSSDGALYDTRAANWSKAAPLRAVYCKHSPEIKNTADLKAALRAGSSTDMGGYPLYFVTSDGAALSFESVRSELASVLASIIGGFKSDGWHVIACEVNYEDSDLHCEHSGARIASAYGED